MDDTNFDAWSLQKNKRRAPSKNKINVNCYFLSCVLTKHLFMSS